MAGTTGLVALHLGAYLIGYDPDESSVQSTLARIGRIQDGTNLFAQHLSNDEGTVDCVASGMSMHSDHIIANGGAASDDMLHGAIGLAKNIRETSVRNTSEIMLIENDFYLARGTRVNERPQSSAFSLHNQWCYGCCDNDFESQAGSLSCWACKASVLQ